MSHLTTTFLWDTVFAIPIKNVNKAIIDKKSSPPNFSLTSKTESIKGDFGDWQIDMNGDGKNVRMSIPVSNVTGASAGMDFSWKGGNLIVEVELKYIPHNPKTVNGNTVIPHDLKVNGTSSNPANPVVSLITTEWTHDPEGQLSNQLGVGIAKDIIPNIVLGWLLENLAEFAHVFCTVELNKYIDKSKAWSWTKPSDLGYAYRNGSTLDNSLLGILAMTGGRKRTVQQLFCLDTYAIPTGAVAGFLVNEKLFLRELVLPTLTLQWVNAKQSQFEIVPGTNTASGAVEQVLKLKTGESFDLGSVQIKNGSGVMVPQVPVMKNMSISLGVNSLTFSTYTETNVGSGVTAWCKTSHSYGIKLGKNKKGEQTIAYFSQGKPTVSHGTHLTTLAKVEKWVTIAEGILFTVALGIATDGAAFVVGSLIIGCLTGVAANTPKIVATVDKNAAPSVNLLSFNTTSPITWSNSGVFKLTSVGLNGPLQLGGNPDFS